MDDKTVLILGGSGSLGSALSKKFQTKGYCVINADLQLSNNDEETFWNIDLADYNQLSEHLENIGREIDLVINAAASVYGVLGFHKHGGSILVNDLAIQSNALRAMAEYFTTSRFAYISSSMVYEQGYDELQTYNAKPPEKNSAEGHLTSLPYKFSENSIWNDYKLKAPKTDYGLSKFVGEQMTISYCRAEKIPYTIWRPFNIITPYETTNNEIGMAHVFADFIRKIIIEPEISQTENLLSYSVFSNRCPLVWQYKLPIIGNGEQIRCFTWINDVTKGIVNNSFCEESKNQIFNLGREEPVDMKQLANLIFNEGKRQKIIPSDAVLFLTGRSAPTDDVKYRVPVCTKALKLLDWEANTTLKQSIRQCVEEAIKKAKKHKCIPPLSFTKEIIIPLGTSGTIIR